MTGYNTEVKSSDKKSSRNVRKASTMSAMAKIETDAAPVAIARPRGRRRSADREPLILDAASELLDDRDRVHALLGVA